MAPTPQQHAFVEQEGADARERIVISGMAGLYPSANNIKELSDILYNKVNPITAEALRYKFNHPEVPQYAGSIPQLENFDAQFFKVHYRLGNAMDPMSRKILEQTYHAIYDAGINPDQLSGKKVGVYVGSCFSESEKIYSYDPNLITGFGIAGSSKSMFANRISYWLNAKGPSMAIDDSCCSSTAALEQAHQAMSRGECEAAIVASAYLTLHPQSSVHYGRLLKTCKDGKMKSFDENADGLVRSEAVNVLFLQKAKDALRIYAEVVHVKTEFTGFLEDMTGPKYGFSRNPTTVVNYLKKFYEEAHVPPEAVEYVEALGSAISDVDKTELESFDAVFCGQRARPLLVGSVTSNIGYSEGAMGISAITKVLLGYHTGELAANLHCSEPRRDVAALREGRMRVLTEHGRFGRTYTAVNGMSVTGVNSHVLLHGHYKPKDTSRYKCSIPYLINISARMETTVKYILDNLKSHPINPEELALLHNIHQMNIQGHLGRGFTILRTNENQETVSLCEKAAYVDVARRPLWFVYSGMGSQWAGMGEQLMRIPIFAAAIERCRRVLEPKGIDIVHIVMSPDKKIFDNILHSFVGIAAVQIGLTDILTELGLRPDGIIGHSVGELGCAYADGCLSAEEMVLAACCRGTVSLQTQFIRGSMAAVGLGYQQVSQMVPPEIEVACHNGPESSTISGPAEAMSQFVAELTARGIFAKEVPCSNIAYHSSYIAGAGPSLLKYLKEVIKTPRPRTERWISSSIPQDRWGENLAKYSSAEYHTNNLLNPVLFEETSRLIPSNAVLVEVAPHGLLQAILKRSLPPSCTNIALTRRAHPDNAYLVLEAVGKLFMEGYHPKVHMLYPKVQFPVSTGTPHLSHLVEWAHGEQWNIALYNSALKTTAASCNFIISLYDQESQYLRGNVIRGQTLFPFAAVLMAVWDTLAMTMGFAKRQESVVFHDVHLYAQPSLHDQRPLRLSVVFHRGNGAFEVMNGNAKVASGTLAMVKDLQVQICKHNVQLEQPEDDTYLSADDVYQLFEERDYSYSNEFRSIVSASASLAAARLRWRGNWATLLDGALQLHALRQPHAGVSTPAHITKIRIDVRKYESTVSHAVQTDEDTLIKAEVDEKCDTTRCGGILIQHVKYYNLPPVNFNNNMTLSARKLISNSQFDTDVSTSLQVFLQIVAENTNKDVLNVVGIKAGETTGVVFEEIKNILDKHAGINVEYKEITQKACNESNDLLTGVDLILVQNLSVNVDICRILDRLLNRDVFVVSEEEGTEKNVRTSKWYRVVSSHAVGPHRLELARWRAAPDPVTTALSVRTRADVQLLQSTHGRLLQEQKLLVVTAHPAPPGLKELVRDWRKNAKCNKVHLLMTNDPKYHNADVSKLPNIDLAFNVFESDTWGGEYYVPIEEPLTKAENVTLQCAQIGNLDSLSWVKAPEPAGDGIIVSVHYAGLNYSDVNKASGALLFKHDIANSYGMDFSGISKSGDRVMGIVASGSCSSRVRAIPQLLWPVPAHWSLEDAATVPLAYAHAFYCLGIKAELRPGMSVLIHGGAGALGQAIISIALAFGSQVFTTVSDVRKKHFLKKMFPELKDDHIGNSRDESFGEMVLQATKGKGCAFVITTGSGDFKDISIKCCASRGIILDTTQLQNHDKYMFGMGHLYGERSYYAIDFSSIFSHENHDDLRTLQFMVSEGIVRGYVRPLSRVTYAAHAAARALRLVAASKHRGRALLRVQHSYDAQPRLVCHPEQCQLVLCDDKSFGLQMADRLVRCGATKLYLHSTTRPTAYFELKKRSWERSNVQVKVSSIELKTEEDVRTLLKNALDLGPVEGIYVIRDDGNDPGETLLASLDLASKQLCPNMKYFAVANGNNAIGEFTCLSRIRNQLPATLLTLFRPNVEDEGVSRQAADEGMWRRRAAAAAERALCAAPGVLCAASAPLHPLLHQLANLADIKITEETPLDATLEELGVEEHEHQIISKYLRTHHNISLNEKVIKSLSIKEICELDNTQVKKINTKGLASFITYVDSDELLATTEMVFLSTLYRAISKRDDEFDRSEQYLYIVPGMEGHHERFRALCERLKLPALVLQPGLDRPHETPRDLAHRYAQTLLTKVEVKNNFYLLGYESGVQVALETASILEKQGLTGTVFCVGHMPDEFHAEVERQLSEYKSEEQLQDAVLRHMFQLMVRADTAELESELQSATTWTQKVDATMRSLLGRVPHSAQYARALIEAALARISQARRYERTVTGLRSRVVLLRAATSQPLTVDALQHYSLQPAFLYQLQTSLAHAASDHRCAAVVNKHLHPDILQRFETRNTCETYLLNNDG